MSSSSSSSSDSEDSDVREERRRVYLRKERQETRDAVNRGGMILPGDRVFGGDVGISIWRPSLCVNEHARAILEQAFSRPNDEDMKTQRIRMYLFGGEHGLTRAQLSKIPMMIRQSTMEELGVIAAPFPFFSLDCERVINE